MSLANLLDIVRERPIDEKPSAEVRCLSCDGTHLKRTFHCSTMIGGGDGTRDGDPNHVWERYRCLDCAGDFLRETQRGNTWYTVPDDLEFAGGKGYRILKGMPSCFESYQYTCATCGGAVTREYRQMDGKTHATVLTSRVDGDGQWVKDYRIFYVCAGCETESEVADDYWRPSRG